MGCIDNITAYKFPKQSEYVNRRCKVCFHYDTTKWIMGTVIRDDREEPYETLIKLDDGRVMRGIECQYSFSMLKEQEAKKGQWIPIESPTGVEAFGVKEMTVMNVRCSVCRSEEDVSFTGYKYCPRCGAKMEGR